jgi:CDP-ribitol ribitolphosphotransferase
MIERTIGDQDVVDDGSPTGSAAGRTVAPAAGTPRGVELVEVDWERIQLVLRVRASDPAAADADPSRFALLRRKTRNEAGARHARGAGLEVMPSTGGRLDGADVVVRFNVMCGPGQMPLAAGSWELVATRAGGGAATLVPVASQAGAELLAGRRDFDLGRCIYRVTPRSIGGGGGLAVEIALLPSAHPPQTNRGPAILARRLASRIRRAAFRWLVGLIRRTVPRNGRRIAFTSDSRGEIGGNLKIIHDRMRERGLDRTLDLIMLFKPSITVRRSAFDRLRLAWLLATADVILLDDYQPAVYSVDYPPDVRVIQVWHAWGAFKTVGYSRVGKPGGPNPWSRVHKTYTHATVSSQHEVPFYAEAFGIPEDRVIPTGVPRMDRFLDPERRERGRRAALAAFPAAAAATTVLFAPTFRGSGARGAYYDTDLLDLPALHAVCVEKNAIVLFKMHPFVTERLAIPEELRDRLIDASDTRVVVNDLLRVTDLLITDYSSIVFEYATLRRPMLFFAYDLEEYAATRDFYVPYEEFVPGRIVRTFPELLAAMRSDDFQAEKLDAFVERYSRLDGSATDRIIDQLILDR